MVGCFSLPATTTPANPRPCRISPNTPLWMPASRYSGCWVAFKTIAETVDSSASVEIGPERTEIVLPDDFEMPPGGLNIRWPDQPLDQEFRLHKYKLYAALAFARANRLDRIVIDSPRPRFGIV